MLIVVNHPHINSFRIEGDIPASMLDYVSREYGRQNVSIIDDEGELFLDPHDMDFYREAKEMETPGRNMRMFRRNLQLTQSQLAEELGTTKQAISNMENGIRPISKKTAKELARIFKVSAGNFI